MARGGYSNPMQDHHKKARQKELQRNKQKRTKERDEIALQTKTTGEVKEEIQKLERDMKRHGGQQQFKSNAEHKLARLKKELTLLQEAETKAKAQKDAESIANKYRRPQKPLTELDDPRKSIYYDPVMNPYGAPPPGKPRLYHRRFGGVTPNPHEAVVPGEEPPPPPPPPPRDHRHSRGAPDRRHQTNNKNNNHHRQQNAQKPPPKSHQPEGSSSHSEQSPKRQPLHMPSPSKSQSIRENTKSNNDSNSAIVGETSTPPLPTKEEKKPNLDLSDKTTNVVTTTQESTPINAKPSSPPAIPSLPAPSEAVQRTMRVARNKQKTKKGKAALADIWASTEEVEYERLTNLVDLEADDLGTAKAKTKKKKKKKKKKPPLEFYYRDNSGTVQGPFSKAQMRGWIDAGYFPLTTKARTNRMDPDGWVLMGDLPALKEEATSNNNSVQDRIAALKGSGDNDDDGMDPSMQARIAAMRADLMASSGPTENSAEEDSVQERIAALRGNVNIEESNDDEMDPAMQARIAAMRADLMASSGPTENRNEDDSVEGRIAALRGNTNSGENNNEDDMDPSMQARIAAMKADLMPSSVPAEKEDVSIQDRIAALRGNINNDEVNNGDDDGFDPSMQARIAAMRADFMPASAPAENEDDSLQDRIAALRGNINNDEDNDGDGYDIDPSMQARIAAMRADMAGPAAVIDQIYGAEPSGTNSSLQDRIAALRKNAPPPPTAATDQQYQEEGGNLSLQDRIAALKTNAPPPPPPPPPAYSVETESRYPIETGPSAYPLGDADDAGVAAYPIDNKDSSGVAAYPTPYPTGDDEEDGVAAYPLDETNDEDAAFGPYPTDQTYPGAEDLAYPVTDSYPVENEINGELNNEIPPYGVSDVAYTSKGTEGPSSNTKVVKVDKALVSFVPTNLHSKKRKAEGASTSAGDDKQKKIKASTKAATTSDDNYDKFLKEIDGL